MPTDQPPGSELQRLRKARKLGQSKLAMAVDVHPSAVGQWERNINTPRRAMLELLDETLEAHGSLLAAYGYVTPQDLPAEVAALRAQVATLTDQMDELIGRVSTLGDEVVRLSRQGRQVGAGST